MNTTTQPYAHPAREWYNNDHSRRECIACGWPTTGIGTTLRHTNEAFRPTPPKPADADAFRLAVRVVYHSLEEAVDDFGRAQAAVDALAAAGGLRLGASLRTTTDTAYEALDTMLTNRVTDVDRARRIVEAIYGAGALRARRSAWKTPTAA